MGIKDDESVVSGVSVSSNTGTPGPIPQQAQTPYRAGVENARGPAPDMGAADWFFSNTDGNPLGAIIGSSMGGEIVNTLKNSITEIYKGATKEMILSVIPFDREQNSGFYFSCIVICVSRPNTKKTVFYTLILEGTNSPVPSVNRSMPAGGSVEITRLSSDASDNELFGRIKEVLGKKFPDHLVVAVDSCVIPRDFDVKDESLVRKVAYNAALACGNELVVTGENFAGDISIPKLLQSAGKSLQRSLNILINYGRMTRIDSVGNPTRSDVRCIFKDTPPNRTNDLAVNTPEKSTYLAEVNGYMDVVYVGGNEVNPYMPQQTMKVDNYSARFVITDIDRLPGFTIGSLLLALSTVSVLSRDNYWMLAFRPQTGNRDQIDITDIGALGYEIDFTRTPETAYKKIDTKTDGFDSGMLARYLTSILKPGIIVSLDVPDSAPQTWYTRIFGAGARGNTSALRKIVESASYLTGGAFPSNYDINNIFVDTNNRIHLGYYFNKDGQKRDIREIDYVAVANFYGENDRQKIVDWSDTFTRYSVPIEIRLAERKKMIQAMTDNHVEFTGYGERVTFSSHFLESLVNAIVSCGFQVNLVPPLSTEGFNAVRSGVNYAGAAFTSTGGYAVPSVSGMSSPIMGASNFIDGRW